MYLYVLLALSFVCIITKGDIAFPCTTPDNEQAHCISLFSCPHLIQLLGSFEPSSMNFVRKSICLGCEAGDFMVCCGTPKNINATDNTNSQNNIEGTDSLADKRKLLPSLKYCGLQHTDDRIYTDNDTALDEFPWLVHITYANIEYEGEYYDRCSGVLISNRYVLTDGDCGYEAITVILGQYSANRNVTCVGNPHFPECIEPTVEVKVEEKLRDNQEQEGNYHYHFTLLRLAKKIVYSDFIRPICLPMNETTRPKTHDSLVFSGWGVPNSEVQIAIAGHSKEFKKKRVTYDVADPKLCYEDRPWLEHNNSTTIPLICMSPPKNNTDLSCNGDHGGAFMYSEKHQWFVEGIIVDATTEEAVQTCVTDKPINGIKVTPEIINWILKSIRA